MQDLLKSGHDRMILAEDSVTQSPIVKDGSIEIAEIVRMRAILSFVIIVLSSERKQSVCFFPLYHLSGRVC